MDRARVNIQRCFAVLCALSFIFGAVTTGSNAGQRKKQIRKFDPNALPRRLQPIATGLSNPVYVTNAHDGSNRLFIVEQTGRIKVLQPGSSTPTEFLNISSKIIFGSEQGLLGLAFHPDYPTNRRFFVNYARSGDGATVIAEYHASMADPNVADTAEIIILTIGQPFANHNGGMIEFGPDDFLYIGMGDGGAANDPGNRAQNINELLGKMLRIDIDTPNGPTPYSSPASNPFFGATPGRDEIFAVGFRNPFRFSFDRMTNELIVGDVGQGAREEIDIVQLGQNHGWRVFEGTLCTNLDPPLCMGGGFTPPTAEYSHAGGRCAIIGGYRYRGSLGTVPTGAYVFGDLCTGEVFLLQGTTQSLLIDSDMTISSFGEDEAGEIFMCDLGGTVYRIRAQVGTPGTDTAGLLEPPGSRFFLSNTNTSAPASLVFSYGPAGAGWIPISGDWDGDGVNGIGLFDPAASIFFLRNANSTGPADLTLSFGPAGAGWIPVAGDWDGNGIDTIGLYNPAASVFFLRNTNTSGAANLVFTYGPAGAGWLPVAGDWNGGGIDTIGLYNPATSTFFLSNSHVTAPASIVFGYGPAGAGWIPITGDWNGDGTDTIGLYNPATSTFFLRNSNNSAPADLTFAYGPAGAGWKPCPGDWDGL